MYTKSPKNIQEIANEVLNFFIIFSDLAKKNGDRKHHLTAGHLAIMMAIPESFENGEHLISTFSCMRVFKSYRALNYPGTYASFRKNLNELVRLGFLKKENYEYSYDIHLSKQQIDIGTQLN